MCEAEVPIDFKVELIAAGLDCNRELCWLSVQVSSGQASVLHVDPAKSGHIVCWKPVLCCCSRMLH